jgi:hypothetical protein
MTMACAKNPFSTRGTEDPYGSAGTWETPQTPAVAVQNLLYAYNEMVISNYELCFSDSFLFSSPEDSIDAVNDGRGDLFAGWNKQVEVGVANNIFSTYSASDSLDLLLTLIPAEDYVDIIGDTTAVLYRNYSLILLSAVSDTITAEGLATFHLCQEQLNWWTIYLWQDIPAVSGETDWGDIKAEYRR